MKISDPVFHKILKNIDFFCLTGFKSLYVFAQVLSKETCGRRWEECLVHMKMASVVYCLNDFPTVADHIIQAVLCLDNSMPDAPDDLIDERRKLSQVTHICCLLPQIRARFPKRFLYYKFEQVKQVTFRTTNPPQEFL